MLNVVDPTNPTEQDNSYISLADARTRAIFLNVELPADDTKAEAALYQGKQYVDDRCFNGAVVLQLQGCAFPRKEMWFNGAEYPSDKIPSDVIDAQIIAAAAAGDGSLWTSQSSGSGVKRKKVSELEIEYFEGATSAGKVKVSRADDILDKFECGFSTNANYFWVG